MTRSRFQAGVGQGEEREALFVSGENAARESRVDDSRRRGASWLREKDMVDSERSLEVEESEFGNGVVDRQPGSGSLVVHAPGFGCRQP